MFSSVTFIVAHDESTDAFQEMCENVAEVYASGDIVMMHWSVKVDVPEPVTKWFVNEECDVYSYNADDQAAHFPNDFHRAFDTEAEAEHAATQMLNITALLGPINHS